MVTQALLEEDRSLWSRLLSVKRDERASVALAVLAFFCLLFAIFLLRPLRDEMGLRGGARNLKWLWSVTLAGTVVASIAFAACASGFPRRTFMAATYRGVALVWLVFLPLVSFTDGALGIFVSRAFYVTHAVSNVFLVSLFWALAADVLDAAQSKRLFGLIAVGGTLGAIAGTKLTGWIAGLGAKGGAGSSEASAAHDLALWMIVPAAVLMEVAVQLGAALARRSERASAQSSELSRALGGDALEGLALVVRRPYLQGIALFTFAYGFVQTFFTLQQNHIVEAVISGKAERIEYFASAENSAQVLTLVVQVFVTGRLMRALGVGGALLVLPIVGVAGFSALGSLHSIGIDALTAVTLCIVAWRGLSHATMRPAREALYVPTERSEKFKAKSFSDTFAFRGGDLASAFGFDALPLAAATLVGIPLAVGWGALGLWLARRQRALVAERER
ncbi:MAG: hypothetical protein IT454_05995 [Planctomycetes bacterium]|nr:hypothetical protein [Planctomycetota bacterium]